MDKNLVINIISYLVLVFAIYKMKDFVLDFVKEFKHKKHFKNNNFEFRCQKCHKILEESEEKSEFENEVRKLKLKIEQEKGE